MKLLDKLFLTLVVNLFASSLLVATERPNVLFLTMDDMNYDSIESYGLEIEGLTPHMDSLAEMGTRFEYAYIQTPSCSPSR